MFLFRLGMFATRNRESEDVVKNIKKVDLG